MRTSRNTKKLKVNKHHYRYTYTNNLLIIQRRSWWVWFEVGTWLCSHEPTEAEIIELITAPGPFKVTGNEVANY